MFDSLLTALNATGIPFEAYGWDHSPAAPYGVVSIEGTGDVVAGDDQIIHQALRGSIDLYVGSPDLSWMTTVQSAINGLVAWRLNSVQHEEDTNLIHYEWIFEMEEP